MSNVHSGSQAGPEVVRWAQTHWRPYDTLHRPSSWGVRGPESNGGASNSQPGLLLNIAQA